ncbi:hypothetical protein Tco_0505669 [Tanacetum coccineum]
MIVQIKNRLLAARSRQKSYADVRRKPLEFEVGDKVMLKVSPWKCVVRFGKRNTSLDSLNDLTKYHLASLTLSPFHDNPYIKVMQAYDAIPPPQAIIALRAVLPPSPVLLLSPMFDSRDFFYPEKISSPKDIETPVGSPISLSLSSSVTIRQF